MSRRGGHSGASVIAASCGGAARVQAAAAVNVAALARTVHATAPVAAARAEHAGTNTRSFVVIQNNEITLSNISTGLGYDCSLMLFKKVRPFTVAEDLDRICDKTV